MKVLEEIHENMETTRGSACGSMPNATVYKLTENWCKDCVDIESVLIWEEILVWLGRKTQETRIALTMYTSRT